MAPFLLYKVRKQLRTQKHFMQQYLQPVLATFEKNDGSISETDIRKIKRYYGLAVPAILGEAYASLRGKPMTDKERMATTFLGATTGLFDDFFENRDMGDDYIRNLISNPDVYTGNNDNERLANRCWILALENAVSKSTLTSYASKVHDAQIASRKQTGQPLPPEIIRHITDEKGGYSVLFYRSVFSKKTPSRDEEIFYQAGALLQFENDLFDVYKDAQDDIQTLVTTCRNILPLRQIYLQQWETLKMSISKSPYLPNQQKAFCKIIGAIVSRGLVCLDMLAQREQENNGVFDASIFSRKQLICDMEKPKNLLKTLHYFAKLV